MDENKVEESEAAEVESMGDAKLKLKDIFFAQLNKAMEDLVKNVVNAKNLGFFILAWMLLSLVGSVYRRLDNKCQNRIPAEKYLMINELCNVKDLE